MSFSDEINIQCMFPYSFSMLFLFSQTEFRKVLVSGGAAALGPVTPTDTGSPDDGVSKLSFERSLCTSCMVSSYVGRYFTSSYAGSWRTGEVKVSRLYSG